MVTDVPKKVDHNERQRQITDAVCRITLRGGLGAATFRQIAAEAGMSVPLVQHYFATKAELLAMTQRHVGERSTERLMKWIHQTDGSARAVLGAFLKSFVPADEESRTAGLMYSALYNEAIVSVRPEDAAEGQPKTEAESMAELMLTTIRDQLERGPLRDGVVADTEALLLTGLTTGVGQYVQLGTFTTTQAYDAIDYQLDRSFTLTESD